MTTTHPFRLEPTVQLRIGFGALRAWVRSMGAVILRWRVDEFECEVRMKGGSGTLSLRHGLVVVAKEPVNSARQAYDRSTALAQVTRAVARRTGT